MPKSDASPAARVSMLIRRPAADVFRAITRPEMLTKYWLSQASAPLEGGKRVHWEFMVKGAALDFLVKEVEQNERIVMEWASGSIVTWNLESRTDGTTVIEVENAGFNGEPGEVVEAALNATEGFTIVLCDLKTLLENNLTMSLVRDKALLIMEQAAPVS